MCKIAWSDQEDKLLLQLKQKQHIGSWCEICHTLNENGVGRNRTGKQCRQRYINHLKEQVKKDCWTSEEEDKLFKLYRTYGSHWTKISNELFGRSQNFVKNKFYGSLRKLLRLINRMAKQKIQKRSKPIKYESLLRIIQIAQQGWDLQKEIQAEAQQLRQSMFSIIVTSKEQIRKAENNQDAQIVELIINIHKFNMKTRCYSLKRKKSSKFKQNQQNYEVREEMDEEMSISHPTDESDAFKLPSVPSHAFGVKIQTVEELDKEIMNLLGQSY